VGAAAQAERVQDWHSLDPLSRRPCLTRTHHASRSAMVTACPI